ncbi:flagellin, partial [Shewanella algae]|uniref:flagellin n=1 Tax=Shewanella algae TaxID=38313 RepID=UPI00313EA2D5
TARGNIGNFQRNVLESNIRSLGVASENLSAANSTITDTDVASETTNYTKLQILQQAGISVLAQEYQCNDMVIGLVFYG